jgi:hypothetical protein
MQLLDLESVGQKHLNLQEAVAKRSPEAHYAYYRRCQVFRRSGEQCKAPAEKDALICHAHAGQLATAVRRERERRAVLEEAVAEMRRRGKPECEMADLFADFKGIQVTLAVMAQALIDGRIDCKTAGRLVVHLQTLSKLLWQIHHKGREERKDVPLINTDDTDLKGLPKSPELPKIAENENPKPGTLPLINADDADRKKPSVGVSWEVTFSAERKSKSAFAGGGAKILPFEVTAFADRSRAHGPPGWKAA